MKTNLKTSFYLEDSDHCWGCRFMWIPPEQPFEKSIAECIFFEEIIIAKERLQICKTFDKKMGKK